MADLINVTPEKLKATASSFQQAGKDVKKTTSDMLQLVRGISSSIWSGEQNQQISLQELFVCVIKKRTSDFISI